MRRAGLVAAILLVGIALAAIIAILKRENPAVMLKGSVILRDTYLLSTCQLPNGKFCIWSYDFISGDFVVHARRERAPELLDGSTRSSIAWAEFPTGDRSKGVYFTLRGDESSVKPLNVDELTTFLDKVGDRDVLLIQAPNDPNTFFASMFSTDTDHPNPLPIFDIASGKEVGRIPQVHTFWPGPCFLGPSKEYVAIADVDAMNDSCIDVYDAKTFEKLKTWKDGIHKFGAQLSQTGTYEFIAAWSEFEYTKFRLSEDGVGVTINSEETVRYPEVARKSSAVVGMQNSAHSLLSGRLPRSWHDTYTDVRGSFLRNGIIAWESVRPPRLRIARANDPASCVDISLQSLGGREWPFQFSDDGTQLITRSAPDSFRILRLALPKISVEQECRLKFIADRDTLTLHRIKPETPQ